MMALIHDKNNFYAHQENFASNTKEDVNLQNSVTSDDDSSGDLNNSRGSVIRLQDLMNRGSYHIPPTRTTDARPEDIHILTSTLRKEDFISNMVESAKFSVRRSLSLESCGPAIMMDPSSPILGETGGLQSGRDKGDQQLRDGETREKKSIFSKDKTEKISTSRRTSVMEDQKTIKKGQTPLKPKPERRLSSEPELNIFNFGVQPRLNQNFFGRIIEDRVGVPTLTAKRRREVSIIGNKPVLNVLKSQANDGSMSEDSNTSRMNIVNKNILKELDSIEQQKRIKMQTETFVLMFNKNPDHGINSLKNFDLAPDDPESIAHMLLVTEGLNKEQIGSYLGSHKEKNKLVLKSYCHRLDFTGLKFDEALRLLLSRFKLPGEAQQIERIVGVFATVFHNDNPRVFADEDTPFILAYSLLMLNTDAHSTLIPQKNKMTRNQFIDNNIKICKTLTRGYLGSMYDNITKQKFETKADYIETIYNRLHQGNNTLQGETLKNLAELTKDLINGSKFVKYGRKGKSHERRVWISEEDATIFWANPSSKSEVPRSIPFAEITDVCLGHNSTQVLIKNKVPSEFDAVVLSIITHNRSLDLRAPDVETRAKWERYFRLIILHNKSGSRKLVSGVRDEKKLREREKLSEIWKIEILPNWESYWDYENRKPKNYDQFNSPKKRDMKTSGRNTPKKTSGWSLFKCGSATPKKQDKSIRYQDGSAEASRYSVDDNSLEQEFTMVQKNKGNVLVTLWKKGIPEWLRSIFWCLSIGNQLEITENLYDILLNQAKNFLKQSASGDSHILQSLSRMESDLDLTLPVFLEMQDKRNSLYNILEAFIFYRPDVGYVKGMCRLVMMLLLYCSEYEAFSCFVNLTHSHHFLSFFRGSMREIEWRVRFFNQVFEEELPNLYNHFRALDLSSEMFLLDWFLSLFSMAIFDAEILSKIWDCFLLEGEVYAIKVGIGLLSYFELELKTLTFDRAIRFLKELPEDLDEEVFFGLIDKVGVSSGEYKDELEKQKVAEINSRVHQAMLEN